MLKCYVDNFSVKTYFQSLLFVIEKFKKKKFRSFNLIFNNRMTYATNANAFLYQKRGF